MSDLTSREEAIDKVLDELQNDFLNVNLPLMDKMTLFAKVQNAVRYVADLPTVEPQEWIPVKDRLPNEDCECWLTLEFIKTGNRVLYESHYDATIEKFYNLKCLERQGYKLIAWKKKPLPSPYKEE